MKNMDGNFFQNEFSWNFVHETSETKELIAQENKIVLKLIKNVIKAKSKEEIS